MEGSYDGMASGYVDEAWAKEHHQLWYEDVKNGADHRGRQSA
jgi:formate dehydrogenase subunit gamma